MDQADLSYAEVARLCRSSLDTVKAWLKPETTKSSTRPPDMAVELLYLKAGLRVPADLEIRSIR